MTSHPEFGVETTATQVAETFAKEITGKNVLITGISLQSIGGSMATAVASQSPATLILASRTQSKLDDVANKIKETYPSVVVKTVILDLASQKSVEKAAAEVNDLVPKLHILINNAGLMLKTRAWTQEHLEIQFGTNHIGPFLFTNLLLEKMKNAAKESTPGAIRIVNVSSLGHRLSPIRFHDYNFEGKEIPDDEKPMEGLPPSMLEGVDGYPGFLAYGQSKTANILFAVHLTEQLKSSGITAFSLHPGSIWTELSRDLDEESIAAVGRTSSVWKNLDQGAATALVAAFDPALSSVPGGFMHDCQFTEAMKWSTDPIAAARLWKLSEEIVGRQFKL